MCLISHYTTILPVKSYLSYTCENKFILSYQCLYNIIFTMYYRFQLVHTASDTKINSLIHVIVTINVVVRGCQSLV